MADEEMSHPLESLTTPEAQELDEIKLLPFQNEDQTDLFAKTQRKRVAKRSFANFGITSLSLTRDSASRMKKRKRKDDKKFVVDKVDGFTFVSAFTLNDFDEYDKNPVRQPLAPTKRKSSSKSESVSSKKRPRMLEDAKQESQGISGEDATKGNFMQDIRAGNASNESSLYYGKKNVSPKSALVRLKKLNVSKLKSPKNQQVSDVTGHKKPNQSSSSANRARTRVKASKRKTTRPASSNSKSKKKNISKISSDVAHMQICELPTSGGADIFGGRREASPTGLSDDEESLELDVCSIDENSSSQFINLSLGKMNKKPEKKDLIHSHNEQKTNRKRKPCRVCCAYPCRIVGAKRIKSGRNQFPAFDISFTSRCQVHTPGEIVINDSTGNKVNVCIQTTSTDIKMHMDFAKRFPYRTISIVSCQPSLYDDDLKLSDNLVHGTTVPGRCNENHRVLEQKRRSELHGLYCKLADTLSISKNKASKQWILENALKEVQSLKAEDTLLTKELKLEEKRNAEKKKRWEKLAGKPYATPKESSDRAESKSKLLELYKEFRQERKELKNMPEDMKIEQEELKSMPKEPVDSSEEQGKLLNEIQKKMKNTTSRYKARKLDAVCGISKRNMAEKFGASVITTDDTKTVYAVKDNPPNPPLPCTSSKSINSKPIDANQVENRSEVTAAKRESLESCQIVRSLPSTSPQLLGAPVIPRIDLTNESKSSSAKIEKLEPPIHKQNQPKSSTIKSNQVREPTAVTEIPMTRLKDPPSTRTSGLFSPTNPSISPSVPRLINPSSMFPTPIRPKPSNPSKPKLLSSKECVSITMVVDSEKTTFRIPKTANGLAILGKLSSLKKLSTDSRMKIAAQFPKCQQSDMSATTVRSSQIVSVSGLVTTTGHVPTPVLPTQWSSAGIIHNSTSPACKPVRHPSSAQTVILSSSAAIKQPKTVVVSQSSSVLPAPQSATAAASTISFATISRPIKVPIMTTAPKINSGKARAVSQFTTNVRSSGVAISEQVKPHNNKAPCKPSYLDVTNKVRDNDFPVIPTSSSINVTLNKLGSITGNQMFNKKPSNRLQQIIFPKKRVEHSATLPKEYQLHRNAPIPILPKHAATVTAAKLGPSFKIYPVLSQVHPAVPPEHLPEILSDIPSELTEASLTPLERIQQISKPLLEGMGKNNQVREDSGICVISNVFSLTDTSGREAAKTGEIGATLQRLEEFPPANATNSPSSINDSGNRTVVSKDVQNTALDIPYSRKSE